MPQQSRTGTLYRLLEGEKIDTKERITALRLQAQAWRLLAVIATHDPEYAKTKIGWLMFVTVPYVDQKALEGFIEQHEEMAKEYGRLSGVFTDEEGT